MVPQVNCTHFNLVNQLKGSISSKSWKRRSDHLVDWQPLPSWVSQIAPRNEIWFRWWKWKESWQACIVILHGIVDRSWWRNTSSKSWRNHKNRAHSVTFCRSNLSIPYTIALRDRYPVWVPSVRIEYLNSVSRNDPRTSKSSLSLMVPITLVLWWVVRNWVKWILSDMIIALKLCRYPSSSFNHVLFVLRSHLSKAINCSWRTNTDKPKFRIACCLYGRHSVQVCTYHLVRTT